MHEKSGCFCFFYISITADIILIIKIGPNHGISVYKKALTSEHRKKLKFSRKCLLVSLLVCTLPNFCGRASSKTSVNIKTNFTRSFFFFFFVLKLRADSVLVEIEQKIKRGELLKKLNYKIQ